MDFRTNPNELSVPVTVPNYDDYTRREIERAEYFTACQFHGRGHFRQLRRETLAEIRAAAAHYFDPERTLVYAVRGMLSTHVPNDFLLEGNE